MTGQGEFKLQNFREMVSRRLTLPIHLGQPWRVRVAERLSAESEEWIRLGVETGYFANSRTAPSTANDQVDTEFERNLLAAWEDVDDVYIEALGLIHFATDTEWQLAAESARRVLFLRVPGRETGPSDAWVTAEVHDHGGSPSAWRSPRSHPSETRYAQLETLRTSAAARVRQSITLNRDSVVNVPASSSTTPERTIERALAQIDSQFGNGFIRGGGHDEQPPVEVIPTGSIALDVALGIGGYPRGRIVEIYGPEFSGKTTLALQAITNVQKNGGIAAFIDAEHALDPEYAKELGVDIYALLLSQPDTSEQAFEIADVLVRSGSIALIVIDSVATLVPRTEIEDGIGDSHVGLRARLMSQALRKLSGGLSQTNTTVIFINQLREKTGVFFGSPETTAGGKALKFYASVRLDIRRVEPLKEGADVVGDRTRVKVVKNKMAPPFKQAEFDILYGTGISREGSLIDVGVEYEIVRKSGAWYTYVGAQLGQGKLNARNFLIKNPDIAAAIEGQIWELLARSAKSSATERAAQESPGGGAEFQ